MRYVTAFLQRHGFDADQISGDLNQGARERAMSRIKGEERHARRIARAIIAAPQDKLNDVQHERNPPEKDLVDHRRELLTVKINQEIRKIPEADRAAHLEPWIPVVEALAGSETGLRDLAAICVNFLQDHLPETRIEEDSSITTEAEASASEKQPFKRKRRRRPSQNSRTKNRDAKS